MRRISIVQPYVPAYRVALYAALSESLREHDIDLTVLSGDTPPQYREREDDVHGHAWQTELHHTRNIYFKGRWVRTSRSRQIWKNFDAVVLPLAAGSIDTYSGLIRSGSIKTAVWGHFGNREPGFEQRALVWQARRADHTFVYTPRGATRALDVGIAASKVTTVMNSAAVGDAVTLKVHEDHGTKDQLSFIGALDDSKRIDILIAALRRLQSSHPRVKILIAGDGPLRQLVAEANLSAVTLVGRADNRLKADMLASSAAILCPGRVGLVAVDSLAWGVPIITTENLLHAPEFDYLTPGTNCIVSKCDDISFYQAIVRFIDDLVHQQTITANCRLTPAPTLANATANFASGILTLLAS